jgi:hypothetical protein
MVTVRSSSTLSSGSGSAKQDPLAEVAPQGEELLELVGPFDPPGDRAAPEIAARSMIAAVSADSSPPSFTPSNDLSIFKMSTRSLTPSSFSSASRWIGVPSRDRDHPQIRPFAAQEPDRVDGLGNERGGADRNRRPRVTRRSWSGARSERRIDSCSAAATPRR